MRDSSRTRSGVEAGDAFLEGFVFVFNAGDGRAQPGPFGPEQSTTNRQPRGDCPWNPAKREGPSAREFLGRELVSDVLEDGLAHHLGCFVLRNQCRQDGRGPFQFAHQSGEFGVSRQLAFEGGKLFALESAEDVKRCQFFLFVRAHA